MDRLVVMLIAETVYDCGVAGVPKPVVKAAMEVVEAVITGADEVAATSWMYMARLPVLLIRSCRLALLSFTGTEYATAVVEVVVLV